MSGYSVELEKAALANAYFRKVLFTAPHSQLVLMSLQPGEDIGMEVLTIRISSSDRSRKPRRLLIGMS